MTSATRVSACAGAAVSASSATSRIIVDLTSQRIAPRSKAHSRGILHAVARNIERPVLREDAGLALEGVEPGTQVEGVLARGQHGAALGADVPVAAGHVIAPGDVALGREWVALGDGEALDGTAIDREVDIVQPIGAAV